MAAVVAICHDRVPRSSVTDAKELPDVPDLDGTSTHENLKRAFSRESEASRRYRWFAQQADIDGRPDLADLFRTVAQGETGHAFGHLEFLAEVGDPSSGEPIGDTEANLRAAVASERYESVEMYPAFAATARAEGFADVAEWFESLARAEQAQVDRLVAGLDSL